MASLSDSPCAPRSCAGAHRALEYLLCVFLQGSVSVSLPVCGWTQGHRSVVVLCGASISAAEAFSEREKTQSQCSLQPLRVINAAAFSAGQCLWIFTTTFLWSCSVQDKFLRLAASVEQLQKPTADCSVLFQGTPQQCRSSPRLCSPSSSTSLVTH